MSPSDDVLGKAFDARIARRLAAFAWPHRAKVVISLALLAAAAAVQLVQPWLLKVAIDEHVTKGDARGLAGPAALFLLALLADAGLGWLQLWSLDRTGQDVVLDLRRAVFTHLHRLPSAWFDRNPIGRLVTRVTSDVEALNEAFASGLVLILADVAKLAAIVVLLTWMDWRLALVTFSVIPPMLAVTWFVKLRVRDAYRRVRTAVARLNSSLQETLAGIRLLHLFRREQAHAAEFDELNEEHRDAQLVGVFHESVFSATAELMGLLTLAAIACAGAWRHADGALTFGTLVAFIEYSRRFFGPLGELSQRYTVMQSAMASSERLFGVLDTVPALVAPAEPRRLPARPRGDITFESVGFAYDGGPEVLHDISFTIAAGEKVGIVGWTGAGKSTLVRLLARLYDVTSGRVTLDGEDVRTLDLGELRRAIGVVPQDHFLFAGTIEGNVSLGDPRITRGAVEAALRAVHADGFVSRLPGGLAEPVRERGSNLSVGEKQLLCLARTLAFDPPVLVLDEATSSVDPETEAAMQEAVDALMRGRTAIVIAHRLATIRKVDRILVLHHGRLRESGTHAELMAIDGGIFRTLHDLQSGRLPQSHGTAVD